MKQNSSFASLKQNHLYGLKKAPSRLQVKEKNNQMSLTQSLFPSKKNSLKKISNQSSLGVNDFYQTLHCGFTNSWTRPESKHASRRQTNRPETSKGIRPYGCSKNNDGKQRSSELEMLKNTLPSKSMYHLSNQQSLQECKLEEYQKQQLDGLNFNNIRIVVTRNEKPRKEKSLYSEKFQTNLPDDFLSLFAD